MYIVPFIIFYLCNNEGRLERIIEEKCEDSFRSLKLVSNRYFCRTSNLRV